MSIRLKFADRLLKRHIKAFKFIPHNDGTDLGDGYFLIDPTWYRIIWFIAGKKPEKILDEQIERMRKEEKQNGTDN